MSPCINRFRECQAGMCSNTIWMNPVFIMKRLYFSLVVLVLFPTLTFSQFEYRSKWDYLPTTFKPYVIRLTTPGGINILRDAPPDHTHHHGLMFAIKVDGVNCWEEYNPKDFGRQETLSIEEAVTDSKGRKEKKVESTLLWSDGVGQSLLVEKRTISTFQTGDATVLDWSGVFTLPVGKEKAVLGGNEYHGLGMRFVESMDRGGQYFASPNAGKKEGRLTPCRWMAYTAKVDGNPVTIAMFDTKDNPQPMFAFTMGSMDGEFGYFSATANLHREPVVLTPEKPVMFHYLVVLWDGEKTAEEIEKFATRNPEPGDL